MLGTEKWPEATTTWSNSSEEITSLGRSWAVTVNRCVASSKVTSRTACRKRMNLRTSLFSTRPLM
jgi:hypothetical protein